MASAARLLSKRLIAAGNIGADALRQAVCDMGATLADAANEGGVEAQCAFLLQGFGPEEIWQLAGGGE